MAAEEVGHEVRVKFGDSKSNRSLYDGEQQQGTTVRSRQLKVATSFGISPGK